MNNNTNDWDKITALMRRLFLVAIHKPEMVESKGSIIVLGYTSENSSTILDISLAGRGQQQVLLILAYLYWHKNSVLLIDEPDAHLEILRQRQIFAVLKTTARENGSQVIIATHSSAVLEDAAVTNVTLLLNGTADNVANKKNIHNALGVYGVEHYYKAKVHPRILYVEGSTDIDILRALAAHLGHTAAENTLNKTLNVYYTRNIESKDTVENQVDRAAGAFQGYVAHFNALKAVVPELKGIGLFDGDNAARVDIVDDSIRAVYWKEYEIENYFITPEVLQKFIADHYKSTGPDLWISRFNHIIDAVLLAEVFEDSAEVLEQYHASSTSVKRYMLKKAKMSAFAKEVFRRYAEEMQQPPLLAKGEFYSLVSFCPPEDIPREVHENLNLLVQYLEYPLTQQSQGQTAQKSDDTAGRTRGILW